MESIQNSIASDQAVTADPLEDSDSLEDVGGFNAALSNETSSANIVGTGTTSSTGQSSALGGDPPDPSIDGSSFQSVKELAKWAPLVAGLPRSQQAAAEVALNRPSVAAQMLKSGTAAEKAAAMDYFNANPSIEAGVDTAKEGGKPDGKISKDDLDVFISRMTSQLDQADKSVKSYQKDYPDADKQSLQVVRQSALLLANMPILSGASPDKNGNHGRDMTMAGLKAIATNNPGLSSALRGAASTFSQPGMFQLLDQGGKTGVDLATHNADGKFNEGNVTNWIKKQAPTTGGQFASMIGDAGTRNAVANVNTSKLDADVLANPQNYSGPQKAAVLVKLQTTQQQLDGGSSLRKSDKTNSGISDAIAKLSADPDVQHYLDQALPGNEQAIVNSDPSLARAVQTTYTTDVVTGAALQNGLDAVSKNNADKKKTFETDGGAVSDFSEQVQLDSDLSGGTTESAAQVVSGSRRLTNTLQSDYKTDFSHGGELTQLQEQKGADLGTSLQTMEGDEGAFEGVLNPNFIQAQLPADARSNDQIASADKGSGKAVMDALGSGGKADPSTIAASVAEIDPSQLYGTAQPGLTASDTQALVGAFLSDLKSGSSVTEALAKFDPTSKAFDLSAAKGDVMAKLRDNPNAAGNARAMLQDISTTALGLPTDQDTSIADHSSAAGLAPSASVQNETVASGNGPASANEQLSGQTPTVSATASGSGMPTLGNGPVPSGDATPVTSAEKMQQALMYASFGMLGGTAAAGGAGYWNKKRSDINEPTRESAAMKIKLGGDLAEGAGGALGAAYMLPGVSQDLKDGDKLDAGLSIVGSTRGIVQGAASVLNGGDALARYASSGRLSYSGDILSRTLTKAAASAGFETTAQRAGRVGIGAGEKAGTAATDVGIEAGTAAVDAGAAEGIGIAGAGTAEAVAGMGVAEAIGGAAGPLGWAADAVVGVGFGFMLIDGLVKKAHERKAMENTVNPTLKQFGIATLG